MEQKLQVSVSPHVRDRSGTSKIMLCVILALLPSCVYGVLNFGLYSLWILVLSTGCAVLTEFIYEKLMKKPVTVGDFSAAVTGLLIGMNMPPEVVWWVPVVGSVFAILIVKQLFGGLGQNFMNPALAARCFLVMAFSAQMTVFTAGNGFLPQVSTMQDFASAEVSVDGNDSGEDIIAATEAGTENADAASGASAVTEAAVTEVSGTGTADAASGASETASKTASADAASGATADTAAAEKKEAETAADASSGASTAVTEADTETEADAASGASDTAASAATEAAAIAAADAASGASETTAPASTDASSGTEAAAAASADSSADDLPDQADFTFYNSTGEEVTQIRLTRNDTGDVAVDYTDGLPDGASTEITVDKDSSVTGGTTFTLSFTTESGYTAEFKTLRFEVAPVTLISEDAKSGATPIQFAAGGSGDSSADAVSGASEALDATSGATPLKYLKNGQLFDLKAMFFGNTWGTIGETSALLLLLGGIFLIVMKIIDWTIPAIYIGSFGILTWVTAAAWGYSDPFLFMVQELCAGGLMLGAFFMATDYVTSPLSKKGRIIYALILGVMTWIYRCFGTYKEGVSNAIILANCLVPMIDHCTMPTAFGIRRKGKEEKKA